MTCDTAKTSIEFRTIHIGTATSTNGCVSGEWRDITENMSMYVSFCIK